MIELTLEQWWAIAQEEHPIVVDPESKTAYVVVPQGEYARLRAAGDGEVEAARFLRMVWMRRMGLDDEEIAESLRDDPPVHLQAEIEQLKALEHLDEMTPPGHVLQKYATKY